MNRRLFAQLLAFGAGLFSAKLARGQQPEDESDKPPSPAQFRGGPKAGVIIDDFVGLAQAKLPKPTFDYITTGSEDQVTLRDNIEAFRRIRMVPPLLHGVSKVDLSTTVLGEKISLPVLLAPVAALRMFHPEGGRASARAAAKMGTICIPSTSAHHSLEEIAQAAKGPRWFQLYATRDRDIALKLVRRAEKAKYKALVVTVDLGERKDSDLRNQFATPKDVLLKHLRDVGFEQLTETMSYDELLKFNAQAFAPSLSEDFFRWLRKETQLPIILKGVLSKEAAQQAIDLGLQGIVVSNHGGRRLDGMPASIDVLPEIAQHVGNKIEVLMDGGIRRGSDVLKAVALGAKAVLIGRPQAWGLAADGEAGVLRVLEIFRDELTNTMIATGSRSIKQIDPSILRTNSEIDLSR